MPFRGTNLKAWDKAKSGRTPRERSKIYKSEVAKIEKAADKPSLLNLIFGSRHIKDTSVNRIPVVQKRQISVTKVPVRQQYTKYVPKQLVLDDIRDYRSSKTISNVSNAIATIVMRTTANRSLTNYEKNMIRSTVAFVTSEVMNKALEKPLQIIDNIKMFVKIGKIIYKIIMWFNEITRNYEVKNESMQIVDSSSEDYRNFLLNNPKIKKVNEQNAKAINLLGKEVNVIVDRPIGSHHPVYSEIMYELNYGHLLEQYANDGEEQAAYIMGIEKPLLQFKGCVIAVIHRTDDVENKVVVATQPYSREKILQTINFQEKYFQIEIITE